MPMSKVVIGVLRSEPEATQVLTELHRAGFNPADISALLPDNTEPAPHAATPRSTKASEAALAGAGAGGALGGTLGLLASIGMLAVPGLGPFVAAGPLIAALGGAAAGAAVGGVAGALIGLGIPEATARHYEGQLLEGNILVSVHVDDARAQARARAILERGGAYDISTAGEHRLPPERVIEL